jgi:hypothetical protein
MFLTGDIESLTEEQAEFLNRIIIRSAEGTGTILDPEYQESLARRNLEVEEKLEELERRLAALEGQQPQAEEAPETQETAEPTDTTDQQVAPGQGRLTITTGFTGDSGVAIVVTGPDGYSETFLAQDEQTLDRLAPGTYTITVDAEGFEAQEVEVPAGETVTISIDGPQE